MLRSQKLVKPRSLFFSQPFAFLLFKQRRYLYAFLRRLFLSFCHLRKRIARLFVRLRQRFPFAFKRLKPRKLSFRQISFIRAKLCYLFVKRGKRRFLLRVFLPDAVQHRTGGILRKIAQRHALQKRGNIAAHSSRFSIRRILFKQHIKQTLCLLIFSARNKISCQRERALTRHTACNSGIRTAALTAPAQKPYADTAQQQHRRSCNNNRNDAFFSALRCFI